MPNDIITQFGDRLEFSNFLKLNNGVIIVQFTASWCKPCKQIKMYIEEKFSICPNNIICCRLDIDENSDLYAFMKKNRQINGVPSLVAYFKGNLTPYANISISGININSIDYFFNECFKVVK